MISSKLFSFVLISVKLPVVEVQESCLMAEWQKMLNNPQHSDVTFHLEGNVRIAAHKVILGAASANFARVLSIVELKEVRTIRLRCQRCLMSCS